MNTRWHVTKRVKGAKKYFKREGVVTNSIFGKNETDLVIIPTYEDEYEDEVQFSDPFSDPFFNDWWY